MLVPVRKTHPVLERLDPFARGLTEKEWQPRPRLTALVALIGPAAIAFLLALGLEEYARPFMSLASAFIASLA